MVIFHSPHSIVIMTGILQAQEMEFTRGDDSSHLQLYFYDDDPSISHRFRRAREESFQARDCYVIARLVEILRDNPYSETFRSLGQVEDMDEYHVLLNMDYKLDQRTYNRQLT